MKTTRAFTAIATTVATFAIGILAARAIDSDQASTSTLSQYGAPVLVQGDLDVVGEPGLLVAPAVVSDDPTILDQPGTDEPFDTEGAFGPETGWPGGGAVVRGGVFSPESTDAETVDGDTPTTEPGTVEPLDLPYDGPLIFDPALGELLQPAQRRFDICAGPLRDSPPPPGCPQGYGATLLNADLPPAQFIWGREDHYLTGVPGGFPVTCPGGTPAPGPGQTAYTVFSQTPLDALFIVWRPYGTTIPGQSLLVDPATLGDQSTAWLDRLAAEPWTRDGFGHLPRCVVLDRDPDTAYDVFMIGSDIYGRRVSARGVLVDATPDLRPPTSAQIGGGGWPVAQVTGWTKPGGSVTFTTKVMTSVVDRTCASGRFDGGTDYSVNGRRPSPIGVFDPEFTRQVTTSVAMPAGGMVLLCATIYDTDNTLRPLATDTLVLTAPSAQRPVITLVGFNLTQTVIGQFSSRSADRGGDIQLLDVAVAGGSLTVTADTPYGCGQSYTEAREMSSRPFREVHHVAYPVDTPLLDCPRSPLIDSSGRLEVPIVITRTDPDGGPQVRQSPWISIQLDNCDPGCPHRPSEQYHFYLHTPLPAEECNEHFEEDYGAPCLPFDERIPRYGWVTIRVDYETIPGASGGVGTARRVASTDRPVTDPTEGEPYLTLAESSFVDTFNDWTNIQASLEIFSDRPVIMNNISVLAYDADDPVCNVGQEVGGAPATDFNLVLGVCAFGVPRQLMANVTDAAGIVHDVFVGWLYSPVPTSTPHVAVEFVGGDVSRLSWIYEFGVQLDGQTASQYNWYDWTGTRGPGASCISLYDAVASTRGGPPRIFVRDGRLEVSVRLWVTTGGEDGCADQPENALGVVTLNGSFSLAELQSGEPLVLTTPPFSRLQMRVTISGSWSLVDF